MAEMIAYVNRRYLPHEDASISIDDRGLVFGDSVFDIARTFHGQPFKLDAHLDRLRKSMNYAELGGDHLIEEITDASLTVLSKNAKVIEDEGDVFVEQIVTRGLVTQPLDGLGSTPTIIVKIRLIPFEVFAPLYERGVELHVSLLTGPYGGAVDPRVKGGNRLGIARADMKGARMAQLGRGYWTLMFNPDGSIPETNASNLAIVADGEIVLPPRWGALRGVSLETMSELAESCGIPVTERRITAYDILNADEAFITGTSYSMLPVVAVDGINVGRTREVYETVLEAWLRAVDCDFIAQARRRAGEKAGSHEVLVP